LYQYSELLTFGYSDLLTDMGSKAYVATVNVIGLQFYR